MSNRVLSGLAALAIGGLWTAGCDEGSESTSIGGVASAGMAPGGTDGSGDDGDEDDDDDDGAAVDDAADDPGDGAEDQGDDRPDDDGADDDGGSGGLPGMNGPCCEVTETPGCAADPEVESCVCEADPFCCSDVWDGVCVDTVNTAGCGMCASTGDDGGGGPDLPDEPSDCCTPSSMPGCTMPAVEECVCAQDEFCCSDAWDFVCIGEVNEYECGIMCEVPDPGDDLPDEPSDCCTATAQPGCTDMAIETCVCEQDEFCCMTNWDSLCVEEVDSFMCGTCAGAADG